MDDQDSFCKQTSMLCLYIHAADVGSKVFYLICFQVIFKYINLWCSYLHFMLCLLDSSLLILYQHPCILSIHLSYEPAESLLRTEDFWTVGGNQRTGENPYVGGENMQTPCREDPTGIQTRSNYTTMQLSC